MQGTKELLNAVRAGYSFFYCQTPDLDRTCKQISDEILEYRTSSGDQPYTVALWDFEADKDPEKVQELLDGGDTGLCVIARNYNWFMVDEYDNFNKMLVAWLQNRVDAFNKQGQRKVLIIVSDSAFEKSIPAVLQRDFYTLELGLPDRDEIANDLENIIEAVKDNPKFTMPDKDEVMRIVDSARGMTKREIGNAFSFSLIKDEGNLTSKTVANLRARNIEATAGIHIGDYNVDFSTLKGYNNIKEFTTLTLMGPMSKQAKGIILLGPPGTGKTHFCRCLGNETKLPVYEVEMAELFGGIVGETEQKVKAMIDVLKANSPCIVFVDEIEKGLSGVGGNSGGMQNTGDSVSQRAMGQFLKFLSDQRPEGIYVVATCNNISQLPPEWVRAERWDCAPFFIDLPNSEERDEIYKYYLSQFDVKPGKLTASKMEGWSGAEIKSACRIAKMLNKNVEDVVRFIVPVSKTMKDQIEQLRSWSEMKTIPASTPVNNGKKAAKRDLSL